MKSVNKYSVDSYFDHDLYHSSDRSERGYYAKTLAGMAEASGDNLEDFERWAKNISKEVAVHVFSHKKGIISLEDLDDFRSEVIGNFGKRNHMTAKREVAVAKYLNDLLNEICQDKANKYFKKAVEEINFDKKVKEQEYAKHLEEMKIHEDERMSAYNQEFNPLGGALYSVQDVTGSDASKDIDMKHSEIQKVPVDLYSTATDVPCLFAEIAKHEANEIIAILKEGFPKISEFEPDFIQCLANRLFPKNISTIISWGSHALRQQQVIYKETFELINKFHEIKGQNKLDAIINKANNKVTKSSFLTSWFSTTTKVDEQTDVTETKLKLDEILVPVEQNYNRIKTVALPLWLGILSSYSDYLEKTEAHKDDLAYLTAVMDRRKLLYDVAQQSEMIEKQLSQMRIMIIEMRGKVDYIENVVLPNMFMASKEAV